MTLYNVRVSVVDLIRGDTPEAAVNELRKRLDDAGFDPYESDGDAFESETQE